MPEINEFYTVSLLDSNPAILEGYKSIISSFLNFEVIHCETSAESLFIKLENVDTDLVITDIEIGQWDAIEILSEINRRNLECKVIINAAFDPGPLTKLLLMKGVSTYILRGREDILQLQRILLEVCRNGFSETSAVTSDMFMGTSDQAHFKKFSLTAREMEVLSMLCTGSNFKQIAAGLNISASTVKFHIKSLIQKTQSRNYFELALKAVKNDWVEMTF